MVIWTRFASIDIVLHLNVFLDNIICVFMRMIKNENYPIIHSPSSHLKVNMTLFFQPNTIRVI